MAKPMRWVATVKKVWSSWATRSLAVGAVAAVVDIAVSVAVLRLFEAPDERITRWAAMIGVAVGAAVVFFANRYFAFREHNPRLAKPAVKFVLVTGLSMLVHGQVVVLLRDRLHVPFVLAKWASDLAIFTVGQLLLLRFVVFPKVVRDDPHAPDGQGSSARL